MDIISADKNRVATDQRKMDPAKPQAFLSYTRFDDRCLKGGISNLREALEEAVQARTGKPFNIFQDVDDIKPSDAWREKLDHAIRASQLFIPILTPSFFNSQFCRKEASSFLAYEARAGREGLILPIYLIDSDFLEDETLREVDDIARQLHDRQYDDWRSLRFKLEDSETLPRIDGLARAIASTITKNNGVVPAPSEVALDLEEQLIALKKEIADRNQLIEAERVRNQKLQAKLAEREEEEEAKQLGLKRRLSSLEADVAECNQLIEAERARNRELQVELAEREQRVANQLNLEERLFALEAEAAERDQQTEAEQARNEALQIELAEQEEKIQQLAEDRAVFKGRADETLALRQEIAALRREQAKSRTNHKVDVQYGQSARYDSKSTKFLLWRALGISLILMVGIGAGILLESNFMTSEEPTNQNQNPSMRSNELEERNGLKAVKKKEDPAKRVVGPTSAKTTLLVESAKTFRDCDACPEMVVIPEGSFHMGSLASEANSSTSERPRHKVSVRSFALGKNEVTFAEWDTCVAARGCDHRPSDRGWGRDRRPVINVSWKDAKQFVDWLSRKTGEKYRLPSEAEWEYAARAGSETVFHWGMEVGANRAKCVGCRSENVDRKTEIVGTFEPNNFGLYDMHGNVWEWVEDSWHKNYVGAPEDGRAWVSPSIRRRVLRGGSWYNQPKFLRSAARISDKADYRNDGFGFRVARILN